jgi:hypothetical protein
MKLFLTNSYMTNGSYTLRIANLKDTSGKPGAELSTNVPFSYEGSIDRTAPVILPDESSAITINSLKLVFNKVLREDTATKESNYTLYANDGTEWQKIEIAGLGAEMTGASNVLLRFSANLPFGMLQLQCKGVEDLAGNAANTKYEGRNGRTPGIVVRKGVQFAPGARNEIHFILSGAIDTNYCTKAANFLLERPDGTPIPRPGILKVEIKHLSNTSDIHVVFSDVLNADNFQVHFSHMRLEGYINEADGVAQLAQ